MEISWSDFEKIDLRVGTIIEAKEFPQAKKAAYQLTIDFGDLGVKKSSAQITDLYSIEDLLGMQVTAVVNFPPKQIANFFSECLVLGAADGEGKVTLLSPNKKSSDGLKIS